jgi:hypothetical protein
MRSHRFTITTLAILCAAALRAGEALPEGVTVQEYKKWPDCVALTAPDAKIKAVIIPSIGGRIVHYGPDDANIIFEVPGSDGKTLANQKSWFWVGGYQCDIGPETRGLPGHDKMWAGPHKWQAPAPYSVAATSEPDAATGLQQDKEITLDPKTGALTIRQRMKNVSDRETNFCLWDRTLCKGGGFAFFPLNKKSRFASGWTLRIKQKGPDAYNVTNPSLANVKVLDGVLVAECTGKEGKLGADSDAGWIAYVRGKQLLIKCFPYFADGNYTDAGNSVELYWSPQVAELEPLGPEIALKPGAEYVFPETWVLLTLPEEAASFEAARALVEKVAAAARAKTPKDK